MTILEHQHWLLDSGTALHWQVERRVPHEPQASLDAPVNA